MKTILFALGALAVVSAGCDSEVTGGGGGSGGGGGADSTATVTSTGSANPTTGSSTSGPTGSTSTSTSSGTSSTATGTGGAGGSGGLGACEDSGGTVGSGTGPGGGSTCELSYSCEGGEARVECTGDGESPTVCDCYLDEQLEGSCEGEVAGCLFPLNCCFALLGGVARPNTGPFGACEGSSGTATSGAGGLSMCGSYYSCEGGELSIDCEETEGGGATCECKEGQGFTLGTCQQETLSCDYEGSCCYAIFNP